MCCDFYRKARRNNDTPISPSLLTTLHSLHYRKRKLIHYDDKKVACFLANASAISTQCKDGSWSKSSESRASDSLSHVNFLSKTRGLYRNKKQSGKSAPFSALVELKASGVNTASRDGRARQAEMKDGCKQARSFMTKRGLKWKERKCFHFVML